MWLIRLKFLQTSKSNTNSSALKLLTLSSCSWNNVFAKCNRWDIGNWHILKYRCPVIKHLQLCILYTVLYGFRMGLDHFSNLVYISSYIFFYFNHQSRSRLLQNLGYLKPTFQPSIPIPIASKPGLPFSLLFKSRFRSLQSLNYLYA